MDACQSRVQLEGCDRAGPESEVDDEGIIGYAQGGMPGEPAVDAAQPIGSGRATGGPADGGAAHGPMMPNLSVRRPAPSL